MGYNFHLDRPNADLAALLDALAGAFSVRRAAVRAVTDLGDARDLQGVVLLCTSHTTGGDFPLHVTVYPQDPAGAFPTELEAARALARTLGCRCLITDDAINPFTWVLVDSSGVHPVTVEPDALDRNELVLAK